MTLRGKTYLVTGGTGFLGRRLIPALLARGARVRCLARNEGKLLELRACFPDVETIPGDVTDKHDVRQSLQGVSGVFHLAAFKHVGLAEQWSRTCIASNVIGSQVVLDASMDQELEFVIGTSTDKAARVSGVYGATKLCMEALFGEYERLNPRTRYRIVRYGNVLFSTGSVLCKWRDAIGEGREVVITDPDATRFFWTGEQAVDLVFDCLDGAESARPWVPSMKSMRLGDLLDAMIQEYAPSGATIEVREIGLQPGENLHEQLIPRGPGSNEAERFGIDEIRALIRSGDAARPGGEADHDAESQPPIDADGGGQRWRVTVPPKHPGLRFCLVSCDATRHILPAQAHLLNKYWGVGQSFTVLGFAPPAPGLPPNFGFRSLASSQVGGAQSWTDYLRGWFEAIDDEFVIVGLDDYMPNGPLRRDILDDLLARMRADPSIGRAGLGWAPSSRPDTFDVITHGDEYDVFVLHHDAPYRVVCQFSIWRREYLLHHLVPGWSPWDFELEGSARALGESERIIGTSRAHAFSWVEHSCLSGRHPGRVNVLGLRRDDIEELVALGYLDFETLQFGIWEGDVPTLRDLDGELDLERIRDYAPSGEYEVLRQQYGHIYA